MPALAAAQVFDALIAGGLLQSDGAGGFRVAALSNVKRRELERERLFDDLKEQSISPEEAELARDIQRRLRPPVAVVGRGPFIGLAYGPFDPTSGNLTLASAGMEVRR